MNNLKPLKILGIIPARYQSVRFPGKPLVKIQGKSLIERTYENAKKFSLLDDLLVATDDKRIYDHVKEFGGKAVLTSESCLTGTDRLAEAIQNNPSYSQAKIVVNIQGDEPCLSPDTVDKTIRALIDDDEASVSSAMVLLKNEEDAFNPSVVKCVIDENFHALYFSRNLIPGNKEGTFSKETIYYKHMGLYVYRKEFLLKYTSLPSTPLQKAEDLEQLKILESGYKIRMVLAEGDSVGVDRPEDIKKVEKILCQQNTSL